MIFVNVHYEDEVVYHNLLLLITNLIFKPSLNIHTYIYIYILCECVRACVWECVCVYFTFINL